MTTGTACHAYAQLRGQVEKSRVAQVVGVLVPDDDVGRWHAGGEQTLDHGGDDSGARAAQHAGLGKNF